MARGARRELHGADVARERSSSAVLSAVHVVVTALYICNLRVHYEALIKMRCVDVTSCLQSGQRAGNR